MQLAGQDATEQFYALHKASVLQKFASKLCIGTLAGPPPVPRATSTRPSRLSPHPLAPLGVSSRAQAPCTHQSQIGRVGANALGLARISSCLATIISPRACSALTRSGARETRFQGGGGTLPTVSPNSLSISPRVALTTGWGGRGSAQDRQRLPERIRWRRCSRRRR
jgi:hypothetical protein